MIRLPEKDIRIVEGYVKQSKLAQAGGACLYLYELGWSRREVAESLNRSLPCVNNWTMLAKKSGVHFVKDNLTPRDEYALTTYTNYTLISPTYSLHPLLTSTLKENYTPYRQSPEFKGLIAFLLASYYPVSTIAKALSISPTHVRTLASTPDPTLFPEIPTSPPSNLDYLATVRNDSLQLVQFLPTRQTLFYASDLNVLYPPLPIPDLLMSPTDAIMDSVISDYFLIPQNTQTLWGIQPQEDDNV